MYESFFGFAERPFDLTPNPRYLVLTPSHREALSNLQYAIASRKGVTLLTGDAGSGKTTLLRTAIEQQPSEVHCVSLHNPTLTRNEFALPQPFLQRVPPHKRREIHLRNPLCPLRSP